MAVINLSSDNSSLQAQLSGMRQQKQQLEQMLLFGSGGLGAAGEGCRVQGQWAVLARGVGCCWGLLFDWLAVSGSLGSRQGIRVGHRS
jgi:hypothetical protein